ncbi:MAG TPA: hypothetical protein VGR82_17520 [Methylomirabilota bacterium]|jgi:hypothetical protein|nr:hypothetical protein [Methylomirabilota bacterium]
MPRRVTRDELTPILAEARAKGHQVQQVVRTADGRSFTLHDGALVGCSDGSRYVIAHMNRGGFTLRREIPKVKGKAARAADKRRRRAARELNGRLEARRQQRCARVEAEGPSLEQAMERATEMFAGAELEA